MNSPCSAWISAADTGCDDPEMSLKCPGKAREIWPQPARSRQSAMNNRECHDMRRAAGFADLMAPPASPSAMSGRPGAWRAAVRRTAAMVWAGTGAVDRAGNEVAPALLGDGPGFASRPVASIDPSTYWRPGTDTNACYPAGLRPRSTMTFGVAQSSLLRSARQPAQASRSHRGDCSRHRPMRPEAGTRSGYRRDVSLSPVPASQPSAPRRPCRRDNAPLACDNSPARICGPRVAWQAL